MMLKKIATGALALIALTSLILALALLISAYPIVVAVTVGVPVFLFLSFVLGDGLTALVEMLKG